MRTQGAGEFLLQAAASVAVLGLMVLVYYMGRI
jgi:hypothetical protein